MCSTSWFHFCTEYIPWHCWIPHSEWIECPYNWWTILCIWRSCVSYWHWHPDLILLNIVSMSWTQWWSPIATWSTQQIHLILIRQLLTIAGISVTSPVSLIWWLTAAYSCKCSSYSPSGLEPSWFYEWPAVQCSWLHADHHPDSNTYQYSDHWLAPENCQCNSCVGTSTLHPNWR